MFIGDELITENRSTVYCFWHHADDVAVTVIKWNYDHAVLAPFRLTYRQLLARRPRRAIFRRQSPWRCTTSRPIYESSLLPEDRGMPLLASHTCDVLCLSDSELRYEQSGAVTGREMTCGSDEKNRYGI